jgi:hypothetical protein
MNASPSSQAQVWHPDDDIRPQAECPNGLEIHRPEILDFIENNIQEISGELRRLSLDIHGTWSAT